LIYNINKYKKKRDVEGVMTHKYLTKLLKKIKNPNFQLTTIVTLKAGQTFGELALLDNKPRSATIVTKTPCHFAVL
jgi:CRP-like cAMP-binding protein